MEEDLSISKLECLRNHLSDLPHILTLSLGDQTKIENGTKWKQTPMEDHPPHKKGEALLHFNSSTLSYV